MVRSSLPTSPAVSTATGGQTKTRLGNMKTPFNPGSAAAILLCLEILIHPASAAVPQTEIPSLSEAQKFSQAASNPIDREIKVFADVRISARDAMSLVEKRIGAKVVDISFDGQGDRLAYRIKAQRLGKIWNGMIDASTGELIGDALLIPVSRLNASDKVQLTDLKTAGLDLLDAVAIAEKCAGGKAVSAGLGDVDGKLAFLVVVVADGGLKEVSIDPTATK